MKRRLSLFLSALFLMSCSSEDLGKNFTFDLSAKPIKKSVGGSGGVHYEMECNLGAATADFYSELTEKSWSQLVKKYVSGGEVKYSSWLTNRADLVSLCNVVKELQNTDFKRMVENERKTFLINSYNVFTIQLILMNYYKVYGGKSSLKYEMPNKKSIKNLTVKGDESPWDKYVWRINDQFYSLNNIEKDLLIPMGDSRIHFAINCASKGCPDLLNESFRVKDINQQLDKVSGDFVNSGEFTLFEDYGGGDKEILTSQIMNWYENDFVIDKSGNYSSVRDFIAFYLDEEVTGVTKQDLYKKSSSGQYEWKIEFDFYDWRLNEIN